MAIGGEEVLLCCFLWARAGQETGLTDYESRVLALVPAGGGEVVQRVVSDGSDGRPHEVQVFRFPTQDALDSYLEDPRRSALADEREKVIARTDSFPVRFL